MSFYETLAPYYDQIFPTNEKAFRFLSICFKGKRNLLDVGAGTGNMAFSLANSGYMVSALEPEASFTEEIRKKIIRSRNHLKLYRKNMQQLNELNEIYDGIYCIGNTLVHLNNLEEITQFFRDSYLTLANDGVMIIQTVNYENILTKEQFSFPIIKRDTFTFERKYEISKDTVLFTTTLTSDGKAKINTTKLYPAVADQLVSSLKSCGFHDITVYGNYDFQNYSSNSPALILVAKK
ncbi:class I SAM-dependent methyltransferase [Cytobacillus sp. Hz8]|uniref:class I SAM-dependent methyltransferase n=1 Tax=Cytobacillus sp. Hz8 TaxID=3347168 RepID=UPI0035D7C6C9